MTALRAGAYQSATSPAETAADALVVFVRPSDDGPQVLDGTDLPADAAQQISADLATLGVKGAADETTRLLPRDGIAADLVLAVGVGKRNLDDPETLRRAAGTAVRTLSRAGTAVLAPPVDVVMTRAALEGALMGAYSFTAFRSEAGESSTLGEVLVGADADVDLGRATAVANAVHQARDWINIPPGDLFPEVFADQIEALAGERGLEVEVLDEVALVEQGYGGIAGVGQGSSRPPRLVRLAYRPEGATKHLAIVGKGITFDTGGLSIKTSEGMIGMKFDMSGAGAAAAAVMAIADIGVTVNVTAYCAIAENMPSGNAYRPEDVLHMYGGKTVEVLNTDAEGRLVMADALVRAGEDEPDLLIDIATLTGAVTVALGLRTAGVISDDQDTAQVVLRAAEAAGELMWPLPIPDEMRGLLDSNVADITNMGNRFGGALQAAAFLREFVPDGLAWAHLDIAGPARNRKGPHGYTSTGGTGYGVRTLVALAEQLA